MRKLADEAGHLRFGLPKEYGGKDGSNLAMAINREHLAAKGWVYITIYKMKFYCWKFSSSFNV